LIKRVIGPKLNGMTGTPNESTDEELAALIALRADSVEAMRRAHEAAHFLYLRHARLLRTFLVARVARSEVDDLHQQTWQLVWRHLPGHFRELKNFRAWLYKIARHALIDQARKKQPVPADNLDTKEAARDDDSPERLLIENERRVALERCLERLGAGPVALVRARLGGEDYEVVCKRLGLKSNKAYKMLHKAKKQMKTCMERALS
jgi:RNA polymerase sigma-70 factor (ECF subfamily)